MFPLPVNPKVVVLVDANGKAIKVASNIAPLPEMEVKVTSCAEVFETEALGKSFNQAVETDKL